MFYVQPTFAGDEAIQFSGFARLVGGLTLSDNDPVSGYDSELNVDQHSLLGLQASYQFDNPKLSATAQVIGQANSPNSGLQWLYLNYHLDDNWQFKLGKLHTPFFDYSDVINVGYAYPWVVLPTEVYDTFFFSSFNGGLVEYSRLGSEFNLSIQSYFGQVDEQIEVSGDEFDVNVDYFNGIAIQLNRGAFSSRISKTVGDYKVDDVGLEPVIQIFNHLSLNNPIFSQVADALNVAGKVDFNQVSLAYDSLDWFIRGEWTKIDHSVKLLVELTGYYIMAGYQHNQFTYHLTFSERKSSYSYQYPELPVVGDEQIDYLIQSYNNLAVDRPVFNSSGITLGSRWDYKAGLAFKLDLRLIKGQPEIYLPTSSKAQFDGQATLLTGSVEWVF
ncbi:hypothetical protein N7931_09145 [Catenovulum sp. 2E275]|uniref:hypothetical protein n=1 Tax=Catenovulum sp. 2E275 TaxID=2980497 RepID=UPI0021CFC701|nr:hypothetical protein [Catenovulum sp. 2E275]MCU4675798.1 hypothetical protein [Catenovulum sp. 2E275]